jgi:hypothetical protein
LYGRSYNVLYATGTSVDTTGLNVVAPKDVKAGNEYVWEYWAPAITFAVISPDTLNSFIQSLTNLDNYVKTLANNPGPPPIEVTGVEIDTETGNIWVRGRVRSVPSSNVEQAGVNPLAIAVFFGLILAAIGAAVSLRYVYDLTSGKQQTGALDPCNNPGVLNYIDCIAQESKWFLFGALFGIVALVVFLLVKFGPKGGTA